MKAKKYITAILMMILFFSAVSCTGLKTQEDSKTNSSDEITLEESETANYDISDYNGEYSSDKGIIIIRTKDNNNMTATIHCASNNNEWNDWSMSGTFDSNKSILEFSNCVHLHSVVLDEGEIETQGVYKNGTGRFKFKSEGNIITLFWEDDTDNAGVDTIWTNRDHVPEEVMRLVGLWKPRLEDFNRTAYDSEYAEQISNMYIKLDENGKYEAVRNPDSDSIESGIWHVGPDNYMLGIRSIFLCSEDGEDLIGYGYGYDVLVDAPTKYYRAEG